MTELNKTVARRVIEMVGANGTPPQYGFQYFTAGLDPYLSVIDSEYFRSFVRDGGSAFKMVVGVYGGGKTHFLYCIRELAWNNNFAVAYVTLSPEECPFHKLELVYRAVTRSISPPLSPEELLSGSEQGIAAFLRHWYGCKHNLWSREGRQASEIREAILSELDEMRGVESISFMKAVKAAVRALLDRQDDDFEAICQWLSGEGYDRRIHGRYGILQRIDRTTAFPMFRSLTQWIRCLGFSGLVVLLDEAERQSSLSTKQRELHLSNLRELIDECAHTTFQSVMIFYAVPDENFLEGRQLIYEALRQRLATVFDLPNPSGVKIELEKVVQDPIAFLRQVGQKLAKVYEVAYDAHFSDAALSQTIDAEAEKAHKQRYGDIGYKRVFVQNMIEALHALHRGGVLPSLERPEP